jgi:hypothetical protein
MHYNAPNHDNIYTNNYYNGPLLTPPGMSPDFPFKLHTTMLLTYTEAA